MAATTMGTTTEAAARPTLAVVVAILAAAQVLILSVAGISAVVAVVVTSVAAVVQTSKPEHTMDQNTASLDIQACCVLIHFFRRCIECFIDQNLAYQYDACHGDVPFRQL